jgi:putative ABC transport system permease protein
VRRLSSLGSKQLAHRKGRSVLTAAGIVLGVAILFGVLVTNATTQSGVARLVHDFTGNADVLVRPTGAFDATMPSARVGRLAELPDVVKADGAFRFDGSLPNPKKDTPLEVEVRGVVLARARELQTFALASGRFFADAAREAVVPLRLAKQTNLRIGERAPFGTPWGVVRLEVVGMLKDTGAGRTNQGNVAFTSIATARAAGNAGDVISNVRLVLKPGTDIDAWIKQHERDLGPGLTFENANELAQGFQDFIAILGDVFTFFAALTLFVGAFLIYLTLSMAVIERIRIYGTMRALGATRAQVRRVVIAEALALGAVSTVIGLGLGLLIAKGLIVLVSSLFQIDLPGLTITPGAIVAGVVVGMVTTLVSALVPARRAARLSPVVSMKGDYAAETRLSRAWIVGAVALAAGLTFGFFGGGKGGAGATPLLLLGSVLLTPLLLRPLARVLGRVTNRMARGVGDIAVLHLVKERSRSAYTLALMMVVMSMIFSIGGLYTTLRTALDQTIDREFGADITIRPAGQRGVGTLAESFERDLAATPGIGRFTTLRFAAANVIKADGKRDETFVRIIEPESYFKLLTFLYAEGDDRSARTGLERGELLAAATAQPPYRRGQTVRIETTRGVRTFTIAATYAGLGGPPGFVMSLADGRAYMNAGGVNTYEVDVQQGADVAVVLARIRETLVPRYGIDVATGQKIKDDARKQFGQFFNVFYAILLVAAIVGLLGLANTLAMSVLQRYREIGVLRAIGATRGQIRRMVLVESATMGLVAFALSMPLGLVMSLISVRAISDTFGFNVGYRYPATWIPVVLVFGAIMAVLAAVAPGRRAARLDVVQALQFE